MRIDGRTALVTGGASGLGEATVLELHGAGANVVILDMQDDKGEAVRAKLGDRAAYTHADVTSPDEVQAAVDVAVGSFGGLHITVNCAGIGWAQRTVDRNGPHNFEAFQRVLAVNLTGTFNVSRLAAAAMVEGDPVDDERGVIVNTASIAAFDGQIGQVAYSASKGGVVAMTLPMARDLSGRLIRVCTIAPGTFDTPMLAMLPQEQRDALGAAIPHPARLGQPSEYAALVRHIVENPVLNGETIRLDGALRMPPR